jgi:Meckel syndrome type 1 protein
MPTDADPKTPASRSEPPFARKPMAWGRPPATTFRAGPLPRPATWPNAPARPAPPASAPLEPAAPSANSAAAILGGSLIPQAETRAPASFVAPPRGPGPETPAPAARSRAAEPDLTVRPLPPAEAEPVAAEPRPRAELVDTPSPVPAGPAVGASRTKTSGRAPLLAGLAVVVIVLAAAGVWWTGRSQPAPETASVPEGGSIAPIPVEARPAESDGEPVGAASGASAQPAAAPTATAERPVAPRATARPAAPPVVAPAVQTAPPPLEIETAPLIVVPAPPPAAAQPQAQDPDAPVVTQPQALEDN